MRRENEDSQTNKNASQMIPKNDCRHQVNGVVRRSMRTVKKTDSYMGLNEKQAEIK